MDASVAMEGSLGAVILGYVTVGLPGSSLTSTVRRCCAKKSRTPRGSGLNARITVKQCDREGPNVGFPPLTHGRIAVRNWTQNTCSHPA